MDLNFSLSLLQIIEQVLVVGTILQNSRNERQTHDLNEREPGPPRASSHLTLERITDEVYSPKARVRVARVERLKAVREVALGSRGRKTRGVVSSAALRSIPRANYCVSHHQWDVVRIGPTASLNSDRNMSKWHRVVTYSDLRACKKVPVFSHSIPSI